MTEDTADHPLTDAEVIDILKPDEDNEIFNKLLEIIDDKKLTASLASAIATNLSLPPLAVNGVIKWIIIPLVKHLLKKAGDYTFGRIEKTILKTKPCKKFITYLKDNPITSWLIAQNDKAAVTITPEDLAIFDVRDLIEELSSNIEKNFSVLNDNLESGLKELRDSLTPMPNVHLTATSQKNVFVYSSGSIPYQTASIHAQLTEIDRFITDGIPDSNFTWHVVSGDAGTGKSRFAWELLSRNATTCFCGFLHSTTKFDWNNWRPSSDTVIAIDYAGKSPDEVHDILLAMCSNQSAYNHQVRVLLIERHGQTSLTRQDTPNWLSNVLGSSTHEKQSIIDNVFNETALSLNHNDRDQSKLDDDLWQIMSSFFKEKTNQFDKDECLTEFKRIDPLARPLFAAFYADAITENSRIRDMIKNWNSDSLVAHTIDKTRDKYWKDICGDNLTGDMRALAVATLCEGLSLSDEDIADSPDFIKDGLISLRNNKLRLEALNGDFNASQLPPLTPDVIGELFVLETLYNGDTALNNTQIKTLMSHLWTLYPEKLSTFFERAWDDFPTNTNLKSLFSYDYIPNDLNIKTLWVIPAIKAPQSLEELTYYLTKVVPIISNFNYYLIQMTITEIVHNAKLTDSSPDSEWEKIFSLFSNSIITALQIKTENLVIICAGYGVIKLLSLLIRDKVIQFINYTNNIGAFPLYIACQNGNTSTAEILLNLGAEINKSNEINGVYPLHIASQNGHTETVKLLLNNNADPNKPGVIHDYSPLVLAAQDDHADIVELLVNYGADINMEDYHSSTFPLLIASQNGHTQTVKLLLQKGAITNKQNSKEGVFPLLLAAQNGHTETIKLLISYGAIINKENHTNGAFPLFMAAKNGHNNTVELLMKLGATINKVSKINGGTALFIATQYEHFETVKILIDNGAKITQVNPITGASPLLIAAQNGNINILKLLINNSDNINNEDSIQGAFPLAIAVQNGNTEAAILLINNGADVNKQSSKYGTVPLLIAALEGHTDTVAALLKHNANPTLVLNKFNNKTILEVTKEGLGKSNITQEIIDLLEEAAKNFNNT